MTASGRMLHRAITLTLFLVAALGITACDLLQPESARSTTWDSSCPLAVPPGAAPRNVAGGSPQLARICFVPLGEPKTLDLPALAAHYKDRFGVTVGILPAITPGPGEFDQTRRQFVGEELIAFMRKSYAPLDADRSTLLIGFTESDIYLRSTPSWSWAFAQRVGVDLA